MAVAAIFLLMVAALLQTPALFYMATTLLLLMVAAKIQVSYAVKGLKLRRIAPATATVGENVSIRFQVSSTKRLRGPMLVVEEAYADPTWMDGVQPAPAFSPPVHGSAEVSYSFRPRRRGRFQSEGVNLYAADTLGIAWKRRTFGTEDQALLVLPRPEAVPIDLRRVAGWGMSDAESGASEGSGIEPRGIRDYAPGDSLRHIHWRTSARLGRLQVKQFETGQLAEAVLVLDTRSQILVGMDPVLEQAIRNVAYVAQELIRTGTSVRLIGQGISGPGSEPGRGMRHYLTILETLAGVQATRGEDIGACTLRALPNVPSHSIVYWFTADAQGAQGAASAVRARSCHPHVYLYTRRAEDEVRASARAALIRTGVDIIDVQPRGREAA